MGLSNLHKVNYPPHFNHKRSLQNRYRQVLDSQLHLGTDTLDLNPNKQKIIKERRPEQEQ